MIKDSLFLVGLEKYITYLIIVEYFIVRGLVKPTTPLASLSFSTLTTEFVTLNIYYYKLQDNIIFHIFICQLILPTLRII